MIGRTPHGGINPISGIMPPLSGVRMPPQRPSDFGIAYLILMGVAAIVVFILVVLL